MAVRLTYKPTVARRAQAAMRRDKLIEFVKDATVEQIKARFQTRPDDLAHAVALLLKAEAAKVLKE